MTAKENARSQLHKKIVSDYVEIMKTNKDIAKPYSVFRLLGARYGLSTQGVMKIARRNGVYKSKNEIKQQGK